VVRKVIKLQV